MRDADYIVIVVMKIEFMTIVVYPPWYSISARGCAMRRVDGNSSLYMVMVGGLMVGGLMVGGLMVGGLMVNVNWVLI